MKSPSGLLDRDESQLGEGGESTPETNGLASVQIPSLIPLSPVVQGEFLENQIREIDRGFSCFDTNDGDVPTSSGLAVVIPFRQDMKSDLAPYTNPRETKINCLSVPNTSIVVFGDVSDSVSLSVGGKVVPTRRKRIVKMAFNFVISTDFGEVSVKQTSEANALNGLPRKRRVVSRKDKGGNLLMAEAGV